MLQITVHNAKQHEFWLAAGDTATLGCDLEHRRWRLVEMPAAMALGAVCQVSRTTGGVNVQRQQSCALAAACGTGVDRIELSLPASFVVADTRFEIVDCLANSTPTRGELDRLDSQQFGHHRDSRRGGPAPATLGRWFDALATLHQHPASDIEFFRDAARLMVDPVGLDGGMVVMRTADHWKIIASWLPNPSLGIGVDVPALEWLAYERQTLFDAKFSAAQDHHARVVAPLLNAEGQLVGGLFGFRAIHSRNSRRGVRYLEAQLVDLIAKSVSSGLARIDRETTAATRRSALGQRLPREVAQQVALDDQLLAAHHSDVTVLFADLRDFTQLCQRLDTEQSYQILNDVMDCLTDAVLAQQGTIIDYYGDGLAAMWNAPTPQADHALRAAHAARAMVDNIPAVSHRWSSQLPGELALGVGIHTGRAVVGNIGSSQHLKYGPRGATVNLASRIEASTKTLGMPVIVSTATHQQLAGVASVRLCQAQLKGIADVVDLYALLPDDIDSTTKSAIARYDQALAYFEQGLHGEACRLLERGLFGQLLGPSEFLSRQIKMQCSRRLGRRQSDCTSDCGPVVEV